MQNLFDPPPNAITRLSIRDFRGIEKLDLEFLRPDGKPNSLVVLAGPNGCGKTAVLEAALLAVGGKREVVGSKGKGAVRRGGQSYLIKVELCRSSSSYSAKGFPERMSIEHDSNDRSPIKSLAKHLDYWYFSSWRKPMLLGPLSVSHGRPGFRPTNTDENRLWNVKQRFVDAAAIQAFRKNPTSEDGYTEWMRKLNRAWRDYYPDPRQEFSVELLSTDPDINLVDPKNQGAFEVFLISEGKPRIEVDSLSAGQIELFLFLSSLILNDNKSGVIFIDEPELHLDPMWHRSIIRSLRSLQPQAQLIVATHSPEIYDSAMSYERHFLVPDTDPRARFWHTKAVVEQ